MLRTYSQLFLPVGFSPKGRLPWIKRDVAERLRAHGVKFDETYVFE